MDTYTYKVKNKLAIPLTLQDVNGDEVQLPPLSTYPVEARFIDFQLPPLAHAEVIGFDYAALLAPNKKPSAGKPEAPASPKPLDD